MGGIAVNRTYSSTTYNLWDVHERGVSEILREWKSD